jgi:hypothetical protein
MIQHVDEQREIHYECKKTAKAPNKNKIRSKLNKVVLFCKNKYKNLLRLICIYFGVFFLISWILVSLNLRTN